MQKYINFIDPNFVLDFHFLFKLITPLQQWEVISHREIACFNLFWLKAIEKSTARHEKYKCIHFMDMRFCLI